MVDESTEFPFNFSLAVIYSKLVILLFVVTVMVYRSATLQGTLFLYLVAFKEGNRSRKTEVPG